MRYIYGIALWLAVFLLVFAYRFPYEPVFLRLITKLQEQTQAQIAWDDISANILGAKLHGLTVAMPSGFSFTSDQATITPSLSGLCLKCTQTAKDGRAQAQLTSKGVEFSAEKLEVSTGSQDLGTVVMSGNLNYALNGAGIKGELRLVVPELSGVLPMPLNNLEIGTVIASKETADANSSAVSNDLTLYGEGLDGTGNITFTFTQGGSSPSLSGELNINTTGFGTHTIKLGGTWAQPQWNLAGAQK
ncbi:hypothetical protein IJT17_06435 [bacterium]|nr:hypothetical protein [bacterium]